MPSNALLFIPLFFLIVIKAHASDFAADLKEQVRQFALAEAESVLTHFDEIEVDMAYLDRRIRLRECQEPVSIEKRYGHVSQGRITVEISCQKPQYWKIRTPVKIQIFKDIFVATNLLRRGHIVQDNDITLKSQNIAHATKGYFEFPEDLIGKVVYRTIRQGTIIKPSMIKEPLLVERGNTVNIISHRQGITVKSKGVALADGTKGELIPIKNVSSNRTIEGVVTARGTVRVSL